MLDPPFGDLGIWRRGLHDWRIPKLIAANDQMPHDPLPTSARTMVKNVWHREPSELRAQITGGRSPYSLLRFQKGKTFAPCLVGSYDLVADELAGHLDVRFSTFILDIPPSEHQLRHTGVVFEDPCWRTRAVGGPAR